MLSTRLAITATVAACLLGSAAIAVPPSERSALLSLYASANGPTWTNQAGWNGAAGTECSWYGITCTGSNVVRVSLSNNHLTGTIPSGFAQAFPNLEELSAYGDALRGVALSGAVPVLTGLTNLRIVQLNQNQLSGPIPSLSGLTNLTELSLGMNLLDGPIPQLAGLTSLRFLYLAGNQLTGSVPSLSGLVNLEIFDLGFNQLSGAIPSLSGLTKLTFFLVQHNALTGPVPSFAGFPDLLAIALYENQLSGSLPALTGTPKLISFALESNQLTGSIPSLSSVPLLQYLGLGSNQLSGPIPSLAGLASLMYVFLNDNQLSGPAPSLAGLSSLRRLSLSGNRLAGGLPDVTGLPLQELYLNGNAFAGPIHPSMGTLTTLSSGVGLDLAYNAVYTSDATLATFLDTKQKGGSWRSTQTVAPTGAVVANVVGSTATVGWTPIAYTSDPGFYQVSHGTGPSGPFTPLAETTPSKSDGSLAVSGLPPGAAYVVVRTTTSPHAANANLLASEASAPAPIPIGVAAVRFAQSPTNVTTRQVMTPAVTVQLLDASASPLARAGTTVSISIASGMGSLLGTTFRTTDASGRATFDDLVFDRPGAKTLAGIVASVPAVTSAAFTVSCPAIAIGPATLSGAASGVPYSAAVTASLGSAPYVFTLSSGSLPPGLSLSSTGLLSGTPTANGAYNFVIAVSDASTCNATRAYALAIGSAHASLTVLTVSGEGAYAGKAVHFQAVVSPSSSGGVPTGSVSLLDGGSPIGSAPLENGVATLTSSSLAMGAHQFIASYGGDGTFQPSTSSSVALTVLTAGGCAGSQGPRTLCTLGGLFELTVAWQNQYAGTDGVGTAAAISPNTGAFTFFDPVNVELVAKVLDGRAENGSYWVLFGSLSDVGYSLTVRNTATGVTKTWVNPPGRLASVADTGAFAGWP